MSARSLVLFTVLWSSTTAFAYADDPYRLDEQVAVAAHDGVLLVAHRTERNTVEVRMHRPSGWDPAWRELGGQVTSGLSLIVAANGTFHLYARGPANELLFTAPEGSTTWESLGGSLSSAPTSSFVGGYETVYARFDDGALHAINVSPRSGWYAPGGNVPLLSAPSATTDGTNIFLAARTASGGLQSLSFRGGWGSWTNAAGGPSLASAPSAGVASDGTVLIAARTTTNTLGVCLMSSSGCAWQSIPTTVGLSSSPAVVPTGPTTSIFGRALDGSLAAITWTQASNHWDDWYFPGAFFLGAPRGTLDAGGFVTVVGLDANGGLSADTFDGINWGGWYEREMAPVETFPPVTDPHTPITNPGMGWMMQEFLDWGSPDLQSQCRGLYTADQKNGISPPTDRFPLVSVTEINATWSSIDQNTTITPTTPADYSRIDEAIQFWSERLHRRISLRIATEDVSCTTPFCSAASAAGKDVFAGTGFSGIPPWVFNALARGSLCTMDGATSGAIQCRAEGGQGDPGGVGPPFRFPDYSNPIYQSALRGFITRFGARYKDSAAVDMVRMVGYGAWGEWHSGHDFADVDERETILGSMIDWWSDAFAGAKTLILSVSYEYRTPAWAAGYHDGRQALSPTVPYDPQSVSPSEEEYQSYLQFSAFNHALSKPEIGLRRDGFDGVMQGGIIKPRLDGRLLSEFFASSPNKRPIVAEFFHTYKGALGFPATHPGTVADGLCQAIDYHANYIMMPGWACDDGFNDNGFFDAARFYAENSAPDGLVEQMLAADGMGYRFEVPEAVFPQTIDSNATELEVTTTWINHAMGRATTRYVPAYSLVDMNGNTVWEVTDYGQKQDFRDIVRGNYLRQDPGPCSRLVWPPNAYTVTSNLPAPSTLAPGYYELRMRLVDPAVDPADPNANVTLASDAGDKLAGYRLGAIRKY